MSLILDALRRSENGGAVGSPQPFELEKHSGRPGRKWSGIGFLIVCVGLGLATGWMMRDGAAGFFNQEQVVSTHSRSMSSGEVFTSPRPERTEAAPSAPGTELSPSTPLAPTTSTSVVLRAHNKVAADADEADNERIAALHQQMWLDAASITEAEEGSDQYGAPISAAGRLDWPAQSGEVSVPDSSSAPSDATSIAPPIDLVAALERAAREVEEPNLVPHPIILLENLSQQQKDQIPTIVYTQHIYGEATAPSVELNGQRLGPGQRTGAVTVEDILVDSVILRVNGVSFRLRALNTWVNL